MEGGIFMSGKSFGEWLLSAQFAELLSSIFFRLFLTAIGFAFVVGATCGSIWFCKYVITW